MEFPDLKSRLGGGFLSFLRRSRGDFRTGKGNVRVAAGHLIISLHGKFGAIFPAISPIFFARAFGARENPCSSLVGGAREKRTLCEKTLLVHFEYQRRTILLSSFQEVVRVRGKFPI